MVAAGLGDDLLLANEVLEPTRLTELAAAQAGARIDLIVRGACMLAPPVPVRSVMRLPASLASLASLAGRPAKVKPVPVVA